MKRKPVSRYLDLRTLLIYGLLSTIFSIAVIVCAALVLQADIQSWNQTAVVSIFFLLTGGFCSAFLLMR